MSKTTIIVVVVILLFGAYGCSTYNGLVGKDETVNSAWAKVQTQYQRRADLIPNLVNTVKGAADFEKSTLSAVMEARSKATSINLTAEQLTPENIQKFPGCSRSIERNIVATFGGIGELSQSESEPKLLDLQAQLEGTENRIGVARNDFNDVVKEYNQSVRTFPAALFAGMFGFKQKGYFEASQSAQTAPTVKF